MFTTNGKGWVVMGRVDFENLAIIFALLSFGVNIVVQFTKDIVPIPTKVWTLLVSASLCIIAYMTSAGEGYTELNLRGVFLCLVSSLFVSYCAMYGFDTLKEMWQRFKDGENINDDN